MRATGPHNLLQGGRHTSHMVDQGMEEPAAHASQLATSGQCDKNSKILKQKTHATQNTENAYNTENKKKSHPV